MCCHTHKTLSTVSEIYEIIKLAIIFIIRREKVALHEELRKRKRKEGRVSEVGENLGLYYNSRMAEGFR